MIDYPRRILSDQFEASLCMLNDCLLKCPADHWEGIIGKYPFWVVGYHVLCFTDLYLSRTKEEFAFREIHPGGWNEFDDEYPSRRFERDELIAYLQICREKAVKTLAAETAETLQGPSGFDWLAITRGELYLYNVRHVQHHGGQLSAYLRRINETLQSPKEVRWVSAGWK